MKLHYFLLFVKFALFWLLVWFTSWVCQACGDLTLKSQTGHCWYEVLFTGQQSPTNRPKPIFLSSSKLVDIWYARVSDEPETLVQTGKPEMLLRDETQQLIRFGI